MRAAGARLRQHLWAQVARTPHRRHRNPRRLRSAEKPSPAADACARRPCAPHEPTERAHPQRAPRGRLHRHRAVAVAVRGAAQHPGAQRARPLPTRPVRAVLALVPRDTRALLVRQRRTQVRGSHTHHTHTPASRPRITVRSVCVREHVPRHNTPPPCRANATPLHTSTPTFAVHLASARGRRTPSPHGDRATSPSATASSTATTRRRAWASCSRATTARRPRGHRRSSKTSMPSVRRPHTPRRPVGADAPPNPHATTPARTSHLRAPCLRCTSCVLIRRAYACVMLAQFARVRGAQTWATAASAATRRATSSLSGRAAHRRTATPRAAGATCHARIRFGWRETTTTSTRPTLASGMSRRRSASSTARTGTCATPRASSGSGAPAASCTTTSTSSSPRLSRSGRCSCACAGTPHQTR